MVDVRDDAKISDPFAVVFNHKETVYRRGGSVVNQRLWNMIKKYLLLMSPLFKIPLSKVF